METILIDQRLRLEHYAEGDEEGPCLHLCDAQGSHVTIPLDAISALRAALEQMAHPASPADGAPSLCGRCGAELHPVHEPASQNELGWCLGCYGETVAQVAADPQGG